MSARLAYLDTLKVLLVVGVIAMHTAITYGLDGSWYLESYDEMSPGVVDVVTASLGVGWLFGLGLFFLIAGRLSAPSLERKGPRLFAKDRLIRLGIPLAVYTLLVSPFLEYVAYRENEHGSEALWPFVREQVWQFAPGPTWFLEALLVFSLSYALWRTLRRDAVPPVERPLRGPEVATVAGLIAVAAFAVHLAFPVGSEQFHLQLAMFPQYVILFSLGVLAGRRGWLETLTPRLRRRCGIAGGPQRWHSRLYCWREGSSTAARLPRTASPAAGTGRPPLVPSWRVSSPRASRSGQWGTSGPIRTATSGL